MDEVEYKDSFSLKCGHRYCNDCWAGQLKSAIDNYGANVLNMSKCLYPQCPSIVNRGKMLFRGRICSVGIEIFRMF